MSQNAPAYGLWSLVILNSAIFLMFAFSLFKPRTGRDWRTFGAAHERYAAATSRFVPSVPPRRRHRCA